MSESWTTKYLQSSAVRKGVPVVLTFALCFAVGGCTGTSPKPARPEIDENCRAIYGQAVLAAEEAKARVELDPEPWLESSYLTLGQVDLRGDGRKSRFEALTNWGTREGEEFLRMIPPDRSKPIQLRLYWNSLDMYYPPGIEWSANADDSDYAAERKFLDTVKYAYDYISERDILCRTDDPNYAVHFWGKDNGCITEGKLKIRKYKKMPRKFKLDTKPHLEVGPIVYVKYGSGLMAYNRQKGEYFLLYHPDNQYSSVNILAKVDSWLLIGLWTEGLVAVDLKDFYLKRFPSIKGTIDKIDVTGSKIIIDYGKYELDRPISRTGAKARLYFFGPTDLK